MKKLNIILILFCWQHSVFASIHYTSVAKTQSGKPCLNTCTNGYCAVDYKLTPEACVIDETAGVPKFYTALYEGDKATCRSNCGKFGHPYDWCYTTDNYDWDYCSSKFLDSAHEYGYDVYGEACAGPCENDNTVGHFECFTSAGVTKVCARPATVPVRSFRNIFSNRRHKRALDRIFSPALCSSVCRMRVMDGSDGYTQGLINGINARSNIERVSNPAAPYTYVATMNATNANGVLVYLPLVVKATLRQIQTPVPRLPSDIPTAARTNVNHMYNGQMTGIDVGHIIAFQNGGTTDLFNFVGQTAALNRGAWKTMENEINNWINFERGTTVQTAVAVVYSGTKPTEFAVKLKFFNGDGSLHSDILDIIFKNI